LTAAGATFDFRLVGRRADRWSAVGHLLQADFRRADLTPRKQIYH